MATATELERLIVSLEASTVKYERALQRAQGITNSRLRTIENRTAQSARAISESFGSAFRKGLALAGGAAILTTAKNVIDSSIKIENSLKVAGLAGEQLNTVYQKLFASAQRNNAPVEALATLYGRVAQVQNELGISSEQLVNFTDKIAVALRVSGRTAEESKGALLQLGQALGGTIVRAEEFNSINEGALPVLQAVAAGLTEAGGSVAKLRQLVITGQVSSKAFFNAFEAGSVILESKVASAGQTIDQSFTKFNNVLIDVAKDFNEDTHLSEQFATALEELGNNVKGLTSWLLAGLPAAEKFFQAIADGIDKAKQAGNFAELTGLDKFTFDAAVKANNGLASVGISSSALSVESSAAGSILRRTFQLVGETPQDEELAKLLLSNRLDMTEAQKQFREADYASVKKIVKPVSLKDFPVDPTSDADAKKAERERQAVKDYIADLEFEKSLIGLTEVEQQKLTAARKAGAAATDEQKKYIEQLTEQMYYEQEAVQYMKDLYTELGNIAKSAIQGIIGALDDGKISAEEFGDILSNVLNMAAEFFLNQAFGSGSNGFASILQGIFGVGKAGGGDVKAGQIYPINEHSGRNTEYFAPGVDGAVIPRITAAMAGGGSSVQNTYHIDARGAQLGVAEQIRNAISQYDRYQLPSRVNKIQKDPLARG